MFTIDDIKAGYLLEMDNGKYYIVNYNNRNYLGIGSKDCYCDLMNFDDNLYCEWRNIKINKIYGRTYNGFLDLASPEERNLLWAREEKYKIGDNFIITEISVTETRANSSCLKETNYKNVEATITHIYEHKGIKVYNLNFDGNTMMVIGEGNLDKYEKIS